MPSLARVLCAFALSLVAMQSLAQSPPWSGIIASDRAMDWSNAGVRGGIPNRTTICTTLNPGVTTAQIISAINNCPDNQVVFLAEGTYNLDAAPIVIGRNNVTLRGAGADKTKLVIPYRGGGCGNGENAVCIAGGWIQGGYNTAPQQLADWTSGYAKGNTVITLSHTNGLSVGDRVILEQLNDSTDSDGVYVCTSGGVCSFGTAEGDARPGRQQRQIVTVAAINGNQVTIDQPLHMPNWRSGQSPSARWGAWTIKGAGLEDLTLDLMAVQATGSGSNISVFGAADSWVKGVRSLNSSRDHIQVSQAVNITLRDSYYYGSGLGLSTSYGIETYGANSILVENNIIQHNTAPMLTADGASGSVYAYNFSFDNWRLSPTENMGADSFLHAPAVGMMLFEGQDGLGALQDNWYGTTNMITFFRNHFHGDTYNNPPKTAYTQIVGAAAYSRFYNFIGNVLGRTGYYDTYEPVAAVGCGPKFIWCWGYSHANGGVEDAQTKPRAFRWGNYDTVTGTVRWQASEVPSGLTQFANPLPASQTIPASLYLTSKPTWFKSTPWPPIGPDVSGGDISGYAGHANRIPARQCWEISPIDPAYGGLNVRAFNAATCYAAPGGGDTTAPTVSITVPLPNSSVAGAAVTVSATATDNVGVAGVQFRLDGVNIGAEDTTAPYSISWDTTQTPNGIHNLTAVARDAAGNQAQSSSVQITVANVIQGEQTLWPPSALPAVASDPDTGSLELGVRFVPAVAGEIRGIRFYKGINSTGTHTANLWNAAGTSIGSATFSSETAEGWQEVRFQAPISVSAGATYTASYHAPVGGYANTPAYFGSPHASGDLTADIGVYAYSPTTVFPSLTYNATNYWVDVIFVSAASGADTTPPTVSVTAPASGATVSGAAVTLSATASDNVAVAGVQFKRDGINVGAEDTTAPYSVSWDTTGVSNGAHSVTAVARDTSGNSTTSAAVGVTVNNVTPPPTDTTPPTVSISSPLNGATLTGAVTITAAASDNVGVAGVQFKLDGSNLGAEDTSAPYSVSWDTRTAQNGSHVLTATARDAAGNTGTASTVTITVSNAPTPPCSTGMLDDGGRGLLGLLIAPAFGQDVTDPCIITHPSNKSVYVGKTATFSVLADGTLPLAYQWYKNGSAISGATSAVYTTPPTKTTDNGALFYVRVSNSIASIRSDSATLTVKPLEGMLDNKIPATKAADGRPWELGMIFSPKVNGEVTAIRYYAMTGESGSHTARIWRNSTNSVVGGPYTLGRVAGWNEYTLPAPVRLSAGANYTVSVSTGTDSGNAYAITENAFASAGGNGLNLTRPIDAGVYTASIGNRPQTAWHSSNYFRDIKFRPDE